MTRPAPFPFAELIARAARLARTAQRDALKAHRANNPPGVKRALARAHRHAITAQVLYNATPRDHPQRNRAAHLANQAAAAYAAALSLAARLDAPTPTTTPAPESNTP